MPEGKKVMQKINVESATVFLTYQRVVTLNLLVFHGIKSLKSVMFFSTHSAVFS